MNKISALLGASIAAACLAAATPATAAIQVYTDATAFQSATSPTTFDFPFVQTKSLGATYSLGPATFSGNLFGLDDGGYATPYLADSLSALSVTTGASAIGFYFGSYNGAQTITYAVDGVTGTFDLPVHPGTAFLGFSGLSSSTTLTFSNASELDTARFLAAVSNVAVPEPASWAMMLLGFGGIGLAMRRRPARRSEKPDALFR